MTKNGHSKIRLLFLLDYLVHNSDEEHPVNSAELCEMLEKRGIVGERKTIYRDIRVLNEYGLEVIRARSPKAGFFVARREFELPEVRLLMDAVLAAPFITQKKTALLIQKLKGLLSRGQAECVSGQIYVQQRNKFENEEIYYSIDAVNRAIAAGRQVSFQYCHQTIADDGLRPGREREFTVSPYALLWVSDKYYLVGNYGKYDNLSNYRLDRMKHAAVAGQPARPFCEVSPYRDFFDAEDYLRKTFHMYNGEQELVELRCANDILEAVVDKFGTGMEFCCHDGNGFTVRAKMCVSEGLIEWLLQYGGKIAVQAPEALRQAMAEKVGELCEIYGIS
ncbi:MAG: WYL domain-containing protein [Clostridiales bacterium]|nr:WYL domain-containing protein [Clostridiales bacterium]